MKRVVKRVIEKGFCEATIGADNDDADRLSKMYKACGFSELVKLQNIDNHYLDINGEATYYEVPFALYLNKLKNSIVKNNKEKIS